MKKFLIPIGLILCCLMLICMNGIAYGETLKLAGGEINITVVDADSMEIVESYFQTVQDSITAAESALLAETVFLSDSLTAVHATAKTLARRDSLTALHVSMLTRARQDSLTAVHNDLLSKTTELADTSSAVLRDTISLKDTLSVVLYDVNEIDKHIHNVEKWLGKSASQTGTDWAIQDSLNAFVATSGNNTWGVDAADTVFVIGTSDTPITAGSTYFDIYKLFVTTSSVTTPYFIRFVWSTTTFAAGLAAGNVSTTMVVVASAASRISPVELRMPKLAVDTKVWAQCMNATDNATVSFYIGIHEYNQ